MLLYSVFILNTKDNPRAVVATPPCVEFPAGSNKNADTWAVSSWTKLFMDSNDSSGADITLSPLLKSPIVIVSFSPKSSYSFAATLPHKMTTPWVCTASTEARPLSVRMHQCQHQGHHWRPPLASTAKSSKLMRLTLIHISEPTRLLSISYARRGVKKK